jgi:hypothetical protein
MPDEPMDFIIAHLPTCMYALRAAEGDPHATYAGLCQAFPDLSSWLSYPRFERYFPLLVVSARAVTEDLEELEEALGSAPPED